MVEITYSLTDTLVDYYEEGNKMKWKWYYPPVKISPNSIEVKDHEEVRPNTTTRIN